MKFLKYALFLLSTATATTVSAPQQSYGEPPPPQAICAKLNIFFTGFVPNDTAVTAAGFNPAQVAGAMQADKAAIIAAGYNIKVVLIGSLDPNATAHIAKELRGTRWDATGVGYGVRGSRDPGVTFLFTDIIKVLRRVFPPAPILFNFSPNSTIVALEREFPIPPGYCAQYPGKDLGTVQYPYP